MNSRPFRLQEATIADIHSAYSSGALTCRKLVEMYLHRIEAYDEAGPELNSIVTINPGALEEAEALDRSFGETGAFVGPLHGVPVLVKDQAETEGITTTFGSVAFSDYVPEEDATTVPPRLVRREQGAVGRTYSAIHRVRRSPYGRLPSGRGVSAGGVDRRQLALAARRR